MRATTALVLVFAGTFVSAAATGAELESAPNPTPRQETAENTPAKSGEARSTSGTDPSGEPPERRNTPDASKSGASPDSTDAPLKRIEVKPLSASANIPLPQDI